MFNLDKILYYYFYMYNMKFSYRNNNHNNHNNHNNEVEYKYTGTYRDINNNDILAWKNNNFKK